MGKTSIEINGPRCKSEKHVIVQPGAKRKEVKPCPSENTSVKKENTDLCPIRLQLPNTMNT